MLRAIGCVLLSWVMGWVVGCTSGQPAAYTGPVPSPTQFKPQSSGERLKPPPPPTSLPVKP